jgi:hypothetical protein
VVNLKSSITDIYPEEIATELYQISSKIRILAEFSRGLALRSPNGKEEYFNGYDLLIEASEICEDLGQGFLEISA